jgi:hypothetical protein
MSNSIKVRCTSQQVQIASGQPCGWTGRRGPSYEMQAGRSIPVWPTKRPCPKCGSRVEEVEGP